MIKEIWKDIPEYGGLYQCSNLGRIKSCRKEIILKPFETNTGRLMVSLPSKGQRKKQVSRIVALTFLANPKNKKTINHKNGNTKDNSVNNLEWATYRENNIHAIKKQLRNTKQNSKKPSKYIGVSWDETNKKWIAQHCVNYKNKKIGRYKTQIEAKKALQNYIKNLSI